MYPLTAILIGCADSVVDLRRELDSLSVKVESEFADVASCLAHVLANPSTKRLFVVLAAHSGDVGQMERLNEAVVGQPILALVDPAHDASLMVRAMRAGAAQVVRVPLAADDFQAAMHRIAIQFGHPPSQSRTITVMGASEGSGSTTIAVNLAAQIARLRHEPCILGEGAVSFGRLATYLNIQPQLTIADLLADLEHVDTDRVRRALTKVEDNLEVITGSYRDIAPIEMTTANVLRLLAMAKQLANFIVIDARYTYEELDFDFIAQTQQLVLVARPTVPSLYNLAMLRESLRTRECVAQQFVVINHFVDGSGAFSKRHLTRLLHVPKAYTVALDPRAIQAAENAGKTLHAAAPHSRAAADIATLARAVLGLPDEPAASKWSWLAPWKSAAGALVTE